MKIAVTGAAGFIGSKVAERLIADGHEVVVTDLAVPDLPYRRDAWEAATSRMQVDLRRPDQWLGWDHFAGIDVVFHLAATVGGVGFLHGHDLEAYVDNTRMSLNVLEAALQQGVGRVFIASSSCAYPTELQTDDVALLTPPPTAAALAIEDQLSRLVGRPVVLGEGASFERRLLTEDLLETGTPDGMYGREKLATLRLGESLRAAGWLDVRSGLINSGYGPGLRTTGERTKYPAAVVRKALACRRTGQPLEIWGDGTQRRGYIYIDDLVDKIVTLTLGDLYEGPVNLTSPETVSCDEAAKLALELLDVDVPIVHVDGPTGPMQRHCSNEKWERVYGPDTQPTFRARFTEFVGWMESIGDG